MVSGRVGAKGLNGGIVPSVVTLSASKPRMALGIVRHMPPEWRRSIEAGREIFSLVSVIMTWSQEYYLRTIDFSSLNEFAAANEILAKSTVMEPNYARRGNICEGVGVYHERGADFFDPQTREH